MKLERLELKDFRSYTNKTFQFGELTLIAGRNGQGKTNVIEVINLLSTGASFRAKVTEEMISWNKEIASVTGIVATSQDEFSSLTVILTPGKYMGKRTTKRRFLVDGMARSKARFLGRLVSVCFRPEDLRLVEGSPSRRRQYFDEVLSQSDQNYAKAVSLYEGALRRRNRILDAIREGTARREQLAFWDATLIKNGNIMTDARRSYCEYLSGLSTAFGKYEMQYDASTISTARLKQYEVEEVAVGYTIVGPHKDDFVIKDEIKDLHTYGSRGEQRLGVLFLKLGAMKYIEEKIKVKPLLLLDDIFSELDLEHREEVLKMTRGRQAIITTAEEEVVQLVTGAQVIQI